MTLILDMPMQERAATTALDDVSATNVDGVLTGGTSALYSVVGPGGSYQRALNLDGSTSFIQRQVNITGPNTIGWFTKFDGTQTNLLYQRLNYFEGVLSLQDVTDNVATLNHTPSDGWHHFAFTYVNGVASFFDNGATIGSFAGDVLDDLSNDGLLDTDLSLLFGATCGVRLYDTVLTQQEIRADYLLGVPENPLQNPILNPLVNPILNPR